jgi:hypothetical protein
MASTTLFALTPTSSPEAMALIQTLLGSGALQAVATPASGVQPVTPLATAQSAIASIPIARDGDVIGADYHNSLRDALASLLDEVGVGRGPVSPLAPALFPDASGQGSWLLTPGAAATPPVAAGGAPIAVSGWMPLELPHGGRLQRLVATGQRVGSLTSFLIRLSRQAISADATPLVEPLAVLQLNNAPAAFLESADVGAPELVDPTPAQVADRARVDNTKFKYFIAAAALGVGPGEKAQINSVQALVARV